MITRQDYRDAMSRLGAAVDIITTDGPCGRRGFTASAVCSVTDDPPTLLVCMNRTSDSASVVLANKVLCVNVLNAAQQELSPIFAGYPPVPNEERFKSGCWTTLETGAPVLEGANVSFDCRVTQVTDVGTHHVLFCEVTSIVTNGNAECLIYFNRGYHPVSAG
jgi:flavin reductase